MNAQQKVALVEVGVSVSALGAAFVVYPWLGEASYGMFGLLGLLGLTPLLLRKRSNQVITDERDQDISLRATFLGMGTGYMYRKQHAFCGLFRFACLSLGLVAKPGWMGATKEPPAFRVRSGFDSNCLFEKHPI